MPNWRKKGLKSWNVALNYNILVAKTEHILVAKTKLILVAKNENREYKVGSN